jgi:predicted RNA-binding protein associated with RNAse of E/G family
MHGRVRRATPYIVVRDTPELIVLYVPGNTVIKYPLTPDGKRTGPSHRVNSEWVLTDYIFDKSSMLRLAIPGAGYSVIVFWDYPSMRHDIWYINLEEPLRRIASGFELNDQFLDVLITPDLSGWRWKDEDEFAEAIELGLISKQKAAAIRVEGERVAIWIQSGKSPFNGWENWRPDPSWQVPVLPADWDKL